MAVNKPAQASDSEKLENARKFKEDGNECHKNKNYKQAVGKYHRALLQLKAIGNARSAGLGMFMSSKDMEDLGYGQEVPENVRIEVTQLTADCYNNLAACLLQQPDPNYTKIIEYCNNVTELTPQNVKAYYRRGLAYRHLRNFETALESFEQAEHVAGSGIDKNLKSLLNKQVQSCKAGIHSQEQELRETYKNMFSSKHNGDGECTKTSCDKDDAKNSEDGNG